MESEEEVVYLVEEVFREEEESAVGEGSGKVSLVLVQCIFGFKIQIR